MTFERGDVVLIPFPFTDLSGLKRRPVLVLSTATYNRRTPDFVVCGITSVLKPRPHAIPLLSSDMIRGTLPVESQIRPDKLFTLRQSLAVKTLGRVKTPVMERVRLELAAVMGWQTK